MLHFTTTGGGRTKNVYNIFVIYKTDNVYMKDVTICPYPQQAPFV